VTSGADLVAGRARQLGAALADWRSEADLNQTELARRLHYDRTTIAHTEAGRQVPAPEFWQACDELLGASGALLLLYGAWQEAKQQQVEQAAARARAERRERLGQMRPPVSAGVRVDASGGTEGQETGPELIEIPGDTAQAMGPASDPDRGDPLTGDDGIDARTAKAREAARQADIEREARIDALRAELGLPPILTRDALLTGTQPGHTRPEDVVQEGIATSWATLRGFCAALQGDNNRQAVELGGSELVSDVKHAALAHRRSYRYLSHEALLPQALAHMAAIIDLRPGSHPSAVRTPLVATIGEMAALVGALTTLDMRDFRRGEGYLTMALTAATETANDDLISFVLGVRAFHAAYSGRIRHGLDYVQGAVSYAVGRASYTTRAWLSAVASELFAADRDDHRCRMHLDQAEAALATAVESDDQPWIGLGVFDAAKLRAYRGGDLSRLGRHREAQDELTAALESLPTSALKHRATAYIDLAEAHLPLGEVEEACGRALEALELTARTRHADSLRRIKLVHDQASGVDDRAASVRLLGERLLILAAAQ
jgi:tetratricopeptide (TPR) repeat protein